MNQGVTPFPEGGDMLTEDVRKFFEDLRRLYDVYTSPFIVPYLKPLFI